VDIKPSFSVFYGDNQKIYFKDFAGETRGNLISLLMIVFNLNYNKTIEKIIKDVEQIQRISGTNKLSNSDDKKASNLNNNNVVFSYYNHNNKIISNIKVKTRNWKSYDLEFWNEYGISKKWLEFGQIYPISTVFIYKNNIKYNIPADKYGYTFVENKDNIQTYKIYQPKNPKCKWINKHNSSVWDLWTKLPQTNDNLIITSSRKDALCLWSNLNIPATCLQSETFIPKKQVIEQLKSRFNNIYLLYDNDTTGNKYSDIISNMYNLKKIEIPKEYEAKDPSDLYKKHNKSIFKETIYNLINNSQI
jgi:hypothetical protein